MKILIVDDMSIIRDPIAAALTAAGYQTVCASSGKQALAAVKAEKPDLVLLDIHLPDVDGLKILRAIRATPENTKLPVILLSAEEAKESILSAARLGVQGYLLKSKFSLKELLARVRQTTDNCIGTIADHKNGVNPVATAVSVPQLLTREQFLTRTKTAMKAKTLSGVVAQVISLATSPRTELADLAQVVSRDTVLATRVLQAANSAAYRSAKGTVSTISDAIRQVGCSTIRNIAAAVGIFQAMPETAPDGFNPIRCWQHSFAVAQLCETLASAGGHNSGLAYLVGLCHDLGEIVLHTQFGTEYRQIVEVEASTGRTREELELLMLGMTHGELISTILQCFGLPDAVRAPIEWFHANTKSPSLGQPRSMQGILRIAEWYANGVLLASSESAQLSLLTATQFHSAVGVPNPPRPNTDKLRSEIMALTGMLARLSPSEEAELMKPILPQMERKLWIVRDPSLSLIDPVLTALSSLARCQIKERFPSADEMAGIDAFVIVGGDEIEQGASALAKSARKIPTARVVPDAARSIDGIMFRCPVALTQLKSFCQGVVDLQQAA